MATWYSRPNVVNQIVVFLMQSIVVLCLRISLLSLIRRSLIFSKRLWILRWWRLLFNISKTEVVQFKFLFLNDEWWIFYPQEFLVALRLIGLIISLRFGSVSCRLSIYIFETFYWVSKKNINPKNMTACYKGSFILWIKR